MRYHSLDEKALKIWKKRFIVWGSLLFGLGLFGCGAGAYGLYSLGKNVTSNIEFGGLGEVTQKASQVSLGDVGSTVLNLTSDWAAAAIADGDVQSVKYGLGCIEALGGPNAGRLLETLAKHATNSEVAKTMQRVATELTKGQTTHPTSCLSFLAG